VLNKNYIYCPFLPSPRGKISRPSHTIFWVTKICTKGVNAGRMRDEVCSHSSLFLAWILSHFCLNHVIAGLKQDATWHHNMHRQGPLSEGHRGWHWLEIHYLGGILGGFGIQQTMWKAWLTLTYLNRFERIGLHLNPNSLGVSLSIIVARMAHRLQNRGWPNWGRCKLCNQKDDTAIYLFFKCRYTIWTGTWLSWLGLLTLDTSLWAKCISVKELWKSVICTNVARRKSFASLVMLTTWEIWNERNERVFHSVSTMPTVIMDQIEVEAALWSVAGVKHSGLIILRE
jgi:hypothetical protein